MTEEAPDRVCCPRCETCFAIPTTGDPGVWGFACIFCRRGGVPGAKCVLAHVYFGPDRQRRAWGVSSGELLWRYVKSRCRKRTSLGEFCQFLLTLGGIWVRWRVDAFALSAQLVLDITLPTLVSGLAVLGTVGMASSISDVGAVGVLRGAGALALGGLVATLRSRGRYRYPDPAGDGLLVLVTLACMGILLSSAHNPLWLAIWQMATLTADSPRVPPDDSRRRRNQPHGKLQEEA